MRPAQRWRARQYARCANLITTTRCATCASGPCSLGRPLCPPQGPARVMPGDASVQCHANFAGCLLGSRQPDMTPAGPEPAVPKSHLTSRRLETRGGLIGCVIVRHQLAGWSSGMIRASGARGPGLNPRNGPFSVPYACPVAPIHIHILCHVVVTWLFQLMATPPIAVEQLSCLYINEKLQQTMLASAGA